MVKHLTQHGNSKALVIDKAILELLRITLRTPLELVTRVSRLARQHGIPLTIGVTGGGNDGAVFTRLGATDIPISWPLRYSHSPVELIDRRDLDALANLVFTLTTEF